MTSLALPIVPRLPHLPSYEKTCHITAQFIKKISLTALHLIQEVAIYVSKSLLFGLSTGAISFLGSVALAVCLDSVGASEIGSDAAAAEDYGKQLSKMTLRQVALVSSMEEILFRGVIQKSLKWAITFVATKITHLSPDKVNRLASKIAIIVAAILFGWVHIWNGTGIIQVILAISSGIGYGLLQEKVGILACMIAHTFHNSVNFLIDT